MNYQRMLITGGAGFVGSNLAMKFKAAFPELSVVVFDNLKRRGSELNLPRFKEAGIEFIHGDIRHYDDLAAVGEIDIMLECSAEPSVLASVTAPRYLLETNVHGTINCFDYAKAHKAAIVFLSTSRVYPIGTINSLPYEEQETRFELTQNQSVAGVSREGFNEQFPLAGTSRSLYGATKLSAELLLQEYFHLYGLQGVINRCGLIAGPWQMGKVDQGVITLWVARHMFGQDLAYKGFGGTGKQVRDILHIDDLFALLCLQIENLPAYQDRVWNVGGGKSNSVSLQELTRICQDITGKTIHFDSIPETNSEDIKYYVTDANAIIRHANWQPKKSVSDTVADIAAWILEHEKTLKPILS